MTQIDEVKEKTDIVEVIGEHVKLTKAGNNFKGLCPFHQEKTPSFMVSQELQIYKCFGCGRGGDVFNFLEELEGMEFYEALKMLADKANIKLETRHTDTSPNQKLQEINDLAAKLYHYLLLNHPSGKKALEYIAKKRGIGRETISDFFLGAAPGQPNMLANFLKKKGFEENLIINSGLVIKTNYGLLDRFRDRVIFPLYDHRGNAIALAGRILPEFENKPVGKYINSPQTPIYNKSSVLYGLNITKKEIKRTKLAIVVEGELDLISIWQQGFKNAVAIKGTALTLEQIHALNRYAETIILSLDSDFAGNEAAIRGIKNAQGLDIEIKVASLKAYKDPDEYVKADPDGYKKSLDTAQSIWDFLIDSVFKKNNTQEKIAKQIIPVLSSIEDSILRAQYAAKVAMRLRVPEDAVFSELNKHAPIHSKKEVSNSPPTKKSLPRKTLLENRLLELAFNSNPSFLIENENSTLMEEHKNKRIVSYLKKFLAKGSFESKKFHDFLPQELKEAYTSFKLSSIDDTSNRTEEIATIKNELQRLILKEKLQNITSRIKGLEIKRDKRELKQAKQELAELSKRLTALP